MNGSRRAGCGSKWGSSFAGAAAAVQALPASALRPLVSRLSSEFSRSFSVPAPAQPPRPLRVPQRLWLSLRPLRRSRLRCFRDFFQQERFRLRTLIEQLNFGFRSSFDGRRRFDLSSRSNSGRRLFRSWCRSRSALASGSRDPTAAPQATRQTQPRFRSQRQRRAEGLPSHRRRSIRPRYWPHCRLPRDPVRGLIHFEQGHIRSARDVDQDAARTLHRNVIQQRVGNRRFRCGNRPGFTVSLARFYHRLAHLAHHGPHIGKVEIDEAGHHHKVRDAADTGIQNVIRHLNASRRLFSHSPRGTGFGSE